MATAIRPHHDAVMRVISGSAKGRRLLPVPGDETRPITDRVKEALFDIIGADVVDSRWWDVFAGTGAVGIEALSRGARHALFTDSGRLPVETIRRNLAQTRLTERAEIRRGDALIFITSESDRQFDYVYVAPPQYHDLWLRALERFEANPGWLSPDAWVLAQMHPKEYRQHAGTNLQEFDQRKYGTTLLVFYRAQSK